jgi:hypothetical protein
MHASNGQTITLRVSKKVRKETDRRTLTVVVPVQQELGQTLNAVAGDPKEPESSCTRDSVRAHGNSVTQLCLGTQGTFSRCTILAKAPRLEVP